jgi:hypothetical protein
MKDEPIRDAAEEGEKSGSEGDEDVNAPGVEKAASAQHEDVGQIAFEGDGAGEAGKVGEGGVGGEREDEEDPGDSDVIEPSVTHDGVGELGENALVARAVGVSGADVVEVAEGGDSG